MWRPEDPQGDEAGKVKYDVVQYTRGVVLDLGCGPKKAVPHFIGIDSGKDTDLLTDLGHAQLARRCPHRQGQAPAGIGDFGQFAHFAEGFQQLSARALLCS